MEIFMFIVWVLVFYFVGVLTVSFAITQIVLSLRVSLPITNAIKAVNALLDNRPYKKIAKVTILWSVVTAAICWCIFSFATQPMIIGFCVGLALTSFGAFPGWSKSDSNIIEWVSYISDSIDPEFLEEMKQKVN